VTRTAVAFAVVLAGCHRAAPIGAEPIPLADRPPWVTVLADAGLRIAMDTAHVERRGDAWRLTFVTTHAQPTGPDTMRFDRGRIALLVRCDPLAYRSVSQELALGDARPVFHEEWASGGPDAPAWRVPERGATDDRFLRAACATPKLR
jgi:hypothetical protein